MLLNTLQVLVEHLRQKCLEEHVDKNVQTVKGYSVLNQAPKEWELDPNQPCGSERWFLPRFFVCYTSHDGHN